MTMMHNTDFPGYVTDNMYEYRGVGIFQHGKRYRIDFATGDKWVLSLEMAKRVIDSKFQERLRKYRATGPQERKRYGKDYSKRKRV